MRAYDLMVNALFWHASPCLQNMEHSLFFLLKLQLQLISVQGDTVQLQIRLFLMSARAALAGISVHKGNGGSFGGPLLIGMSDREAVNPVRPVMFVRPGSLSLGSLLGGLKYASIRLNINRCSGSVNCTKKGENPVIVEEDA
jgi:hypothetical protein